MQAHSTPGTVPQTETVAQEQPLVLSTPPKLKEEPKSRRIKRQPKEEPLVGALPAHTTPHTAASTQIGTAAGTQTGTAAGKAAGTAGPRTAAGTAAFRLGNTKVFEEDDSIRTLQLSATKFARVRSMFLDVGFDGLYVG